MCFENAKTLHIIEGEALNCQSGRFGMLFTRKGFSSVPMDGIRGESRNANGHIFSSLRGAVADPLAFPGDHSLAGADLQHSLVMFDVQRAV